MVARNKHERQRSARQQPPRGLRLAQLLVVTDETDEHGRLLLEDSAPPAATRKAARAGIAMEHERCPYEDTPSRQGKLMNVSAYDALRRDTRAVLDGFAWLGARYEAVGLGRRDTAQGLADVSKLAVTLPLVLFHRGRDPVPGHGALPSFVASIFKAGRGMFSAAFDLATRTSGPPAPTTAREFVAFAEQEGHLARAQTDRVCAAPTRLIERTVSAILTGQGADGNASALADLLAFDTLAEFFVVEASLNRSLSHYGSVLERLAQHGKAADPEALFGSRMQVGDDVRTFGEFTEAFLGFANDAQLALNQVLERAANAPRVTFQDVLRAL